MERVALCSLVWSVQLPQQPPCDQKVQASVINTNERFQEIPLFGWLLIAAIMTLFFLKLFGWLLIAAIMTVALISTCFSHCCSTTSYLQLKFWKMYSKTERELFETKAKEHAKNLAERNTECFFEAIDPAPFHTPSRENWQKISILYTFNSQEQYYSMLHKYANTNIYKSTKFKKEGQDHTVSPFVEEAQAEF
uniref:Calcium homeostasis modulator family member 6 n=1 Tax=Ficedula albicollis TaxID=59894 RepID=U3K8X5_FICAL